MSSKKKAKKYTTEELWNPQIDPSFDAAAYARQSTKEQVIENIQSHISQTVGLLNEAKAVGFKDDGSTGKVILFVENQVVDEDGNTQIKNASGTWPIDRRPDLKAILDLIEEDKIKLVIVEFVDRLFRDEDRIDSNIFIKACKEHDCFVYVTSKKLIYNFANPQMTEMFRMEVQFAAAYIEHHVRGTMLRRRDQAVAEGKYGGGFIPMGLILCNDKEDKNYKKYIKYEPHVKVIKELVIRVIQLGFLEVRRQAAKEPIFFPNFEEGVEPGNRALEKVEGGYIVSSRSGLEWMLKNRVYIGELIWNNIKVEGAHEAILDKGVFDLLQDRLKEDGLIHRKRTYYHKNTKTERFGTLKELLVSSEWNTCRYSRTEENCYHYKFFNYGLVATDGIAISADTLESLVENRLLERVRDCDLGDFEEEIKERNKAKLKRIKDIETRLLVIREEVGNLARDLKKTSIQIMIDEINTQAKKLEQEIKSLNEEKKSIETDLKESELSIEEELSGLNIMEKPAPIRKAILEFLIQKIQVGLASSRYVRIEIFWKVPEFGVDRIFIDRGNISTRWKDWELEILRSMYPTESSTEILKALPDRTWCSCLQRGCKLKIQRTHEHRDSENIDNQLTWKDRQFLETMGEDFSLGKWTQTS